MKAPMKAPMQEIPLPVVVACALALGGCGGGGGGTAGGGAVNHAPQLGGSVPPEIASGGFVITRIGAGGRASAVTVDGAGRYLLAGTGSMVPGSASNSDFVLARYTAAGVLDTSFGDDGIVTASIGTVNNLGEGVTVDSAGRILLVGYFDSGGASDFALVRYTTTGTLDTSFGGGEGIVTTSIGTSDLAHNVAVDSTGRIVVSGYSFDTGGNWSLAMVRYTAAGVLDTSFGGGDGIVTTDINHAFSNRSSVTVDGAGRILVASHTYNSGVSDFTLVRYIASGVLDTSFGGGDGIVTTGLGAANETGHGVAVDSADRILVTGQTGNGNFAVVRYTVSGVLDSSFGSNGVVVTPVGTVATPWSLALDGYGRILVAGVIDNNFGLVRYAESGALDPGFGNPTGIVKSPIGLNGNDTCYSVAVDGLGRIVLAGGADSNFALARYTALGVLDATFNQSEPGQPNMAFTYTLPAGRFLDPDGDALIFSAKLSTGYPLPSSIQFDPVTLELSGIVPVASPGLTVTATDSAGLAVSDTILFATP